MSATPALTPDEEAEREARFNRLIASSLALGKSTDEISSRQDVKDAVKSGAANVLSLLTPFAAGLAGGAGGPAASALVGAVGVMFTTELHRQLAASAQLALKKE